MKSEYKKTKDPVKERELEAMIADSRQLKADMIYIAMMTDVDLDETVEGGTAE